MIKQTTILLAIILTIAGCGTKQKNKDTVMDKDIAVITTKFGDIKLEFFDDIAPKHVERVKLLTTEKKYDGVAFHRVIDGFMAQTGDIKFGNIYNYDTALVGMGSSDYPMLDQEFSDHPFTKGVVGMARATDPNSANSQFFIMFQPAPHLNGKYTVIGKVLSGLEIAFTVKSVASVTLT